MSKLRDGVLPLATAVLILGFVSSAGAEDEPEEVIVTARRVQERLQDVPISITVFNQQQLNDRNVVSASDLASYTPSLTADNRFGPDSASFAIRGFTQEIRTTPSVGIYFADVVAPRGGGQQLQGGDGSGPGSFFDLQNVQVLKGPQGTLFGRNTTGGAVLLVPTKPTSEFGGYVEGSIGNYNMHRLQGVLNAPLGSKVRLRMGFDRMTRDGYVTNLTGIGASHFYDVDYIAGRVSLVVDVTPDIENYTIATYSKSDNNGNPTKAVGCSNSNGIYGSFGLACPMVALLDGKDFYTVLSRQPHPKSEVEQWQIINSTTWTASNYFTLKNIMSFGQFKQASRSSIFGDYLQLPASAGPVAGAVITPTESNSIEGRYGINDEETFIDELRLQGRSADDRFTWQTGLYLEVSNPIHPIGSQSASNISCADTDVPTCTDALVPFIAATYGIPVSAVPLIGGVDNNLTEVSYRDMAAYAQGTYAITRKLKLTAGIRFTHDETEATAQQLVRNFAYPSTSPTSAHCVLGFPASVSNNCYAHFRQTSDRPTWLIDLEYAPDHDLMVYAKYARGYRQGGVAPASPGGYNQFAPETVDAYEIGAKSAFAGKLRGTFNAAVFYNDFSNQQLQAGFIPALGFALDSSPTTGILNAGKSRIYGAEIESSLQLLRDFRLDMSAAYLDSKLESITIPQNNPAFAIQPTVAEGTTLALTPRYKASITGTYTVPVPDTIGKVTVSATYTYTGKMLTNVSSPFAYTDATNLVNLNLNWTSIGGGPVDASLFVTNLLDETYYTFTNGGFLLFGWEARQLGEPRMFGGRIRLHFGADE